MSNPLLSLLSLVRGMFRPRKVRAQYDAAQTTPDNRRHWQGADSNGPILMTLPGNRATLRDRARYEFQNNAFANGIVRTLANNLIGDIGPRLQVRYGDDATNRQIETAWSNWCAAVGLVNKLRVAKISKTVDGEVFGLLRTNPGLMSSVQLDVQLVEADQVTTPFNVFPLGRSVDGIEYDDAGNPTRYHFLPSHPGDWGYLYHVDYVPAHQVLHWFRDDRPGQPRGISELTPALELFALLRRFTLATCDAAETAANFAAVLKSTLPPNDGDDADVEINPFEEMPLARRMLTSLPVNHDITQLKAEHPTSNHEMFQKCILREIARCLNMPWNIAAGDSSAYNFSSARLDHLVYRQSVEVERKDCESEILEPVFQSWLAEATLIPGLLPQNLPAHAQSIPHGWSWPRWEYLDPKTEQEANTIGLGNGTLSQADINPNWRDVVRQRAVETAFAKQVEDELKQGGNNAAPQAAPAAPA